MIDIHVLLENTKLFPEYKTKHGLSIAIDTTSSKLLLDVGPDDSFILNAARMHFDVTKTEALILSHSHIDHTGGLDAFCKKNDTAPIYLFDNCNSEYYSKLLGNLKIPVGLKCEPATSHRVTEITENTEIAEKTWFIRNTENSHKKPQFNSALYKKTNQEFIPDDFSHEGILVIEDDNELVVFNSCSHNGVINSIESVRKAFANKRIRSYIGGFHFFNPVTKKHEDKDQLVLFSAYVNEEKIHFYTGHCTGRDCYAFICKNAENYMHKIQTGSILRV